ncbi:MAG: hypothetical protein HZA49_09570 [Planctomycetes bacterium]|nr:hypothetical protein [Planctomycetota bacterium]
MELAEIIKNIADILKTHDSTNPRDEEKNFKPGIGPLEETQIVQEIAKRLMEKGVASQIHQAPDLSINDEWAIEFKLARPFGDNGKEAEHWSKKILHPYEGNKSLLGDCLKLMREKSYPKKAVIAIGYEHNPAKISLDPAIKAVEAVAAGVLDIKLSERIEEVRGDLVHPVHEVLRVIGWEVK